MTIHYSLCPADPHAHLFSVSQTIDIDAPHTLTLYLPNWIPGSYMIRDFARNVISMQATDAQGQTLAVRKLSKNQWQVDNPGGRLILNYQIYALDTSIRAAYLDDERGFANGTSVFLALKGHEDLPCEVTLMPPPTLADWKVATSMQRADGKAWQSFECGQFYAENYQDLIDHPIEFGTFQTAEFDVAGVPHAIVLSGEQELDWQRLCDDLSKICQQHIEFFGTQAPFDRYLFLVNAVPGGYGGLEHKDSTALICSGKDLPKPWQQGKVSDDYRTFLGLCSHEYFHAWNVKRIRPVELAQADLQHEAYTTQLWFYEGITSYYDELALLRAGVIDRQSYLELLARTITRVLRGSGRHKQTVADSSFDAWTRFYKQDENALNAIISYYTKGALIALCVDLIIRQHSQQTYSLDDVMRAIWQSYGQTDTPTGPETFEKIASEITSLDLSAQLSRFLRSTEELPLQELLEHAGIRMILRPPVTFMDKGGKASGTPLTTWCGARFSEHPMGAKVMTVLNGSAAEQAGITPGDIVIAVANRQVDHRSIEATVAELDANSSHSVHLFRNKLLKQKQLTPSKAEPFCCELKLEDPQKLGNWLDASI